MLDPDDVSRAEGRRGSERTPTATTPSSSGATPTDGHLAQPGLDLGHHAPTRSAEVGDLPPLRRAGSKKLIRAACQKQGVEPGQLTLHQDRGAPMTAKTFSQFLVDLDILASYSRPRVSDDNPYSESHFKTVKYAPDYPGRFSKPEDARAYFRVFFPWYNTQHRHSRLGLLTPEHMHCGRAENLQLERQGVLDQAYTRHPDRFINGPPQAPKIPTEVWINQPNNIIECTTVLQ
jgi:putative transposase